MALPLQDLSSDYEISPVNELELKRLEVWILLKYFNLNCYYCFEWIYDQYQKYLLSELYDLQSKFLNIFIIYKPYYIF